MEKTSALNAPLPRHTRSSRGNGPLPALRRGRAAGSGARGGQSASGTFVPMEGAVLYQKAIDNSGVRYRHDPRDRDVWRSLVSGGLFVALLFILAFGPRLWVRHSGYRQAQLREQIEQLTVVRDQLKVRKGSLEDLRRVAALAGERGLEETEAKSYTWFAPQPIESGPGRKAVAQLFGAED